MKKELKAGVALKAMDDQGHGLARIATLSAVDSDNDTYAAGAFAGEGGGAQWAQIAAAHNWQHVPLGKAMVYEEGDFAMAELHVNLETEAGREWHAALKFDLDGCCDGAPAIQEWSYGFQVKDAAFEDRDGKRIRLLKKLKVFEVSPVLLGAGVGTGTLAMKTGVGGEGLSFAEQLDATIAAVAEAAERAHALKHLRAEDGRAISATRMKQIADLHDGLGSLIDTAEGEARMARHEAARFAAIQSRHHLR